MDTLADVVAAGREREGVAFDSPDRATGYSYREFCTNAWKAGNLLRHYGVREGAEVAVVTGPKAPEPDDEPGSLAETPDPLLAAVGATLLGAAVDLDLEPTVDAAALVAPDAWLGRDDTGPGPSRLAYGGPPAEADVVHFERQLWSENPVAPPETVTAERTALVGREDYTHGDLLARAEALVESHGIQAGDRVAVDGRLEAEVFAPGIVAPLLAGATIVGGSGPTADVHVGEGGEVG